MALAVGISVMCSWIVAEKRPPADELDELTKRFKFARQSLAKPKPADDEIFAYEYESFANFIKAFLPVASTFFEVGEHKFLCVADALNSTVTVRAISGDSVNSVQDINLRPNNSEKGTERPSACVQGDWNKDGLTDLVVGFWGRSPLLLVAKEETTAAAFAFNVEELTAQQEVWYTQSIASGDIDGDGAIDLVFGNYFPDNAKILANGPGSLIEMNNGWNQANNGGVNRLFLGRNSKQRPLFTEFPQAFAGLPARWTIAVGIADLDGDLLPEIIFLNDHGPNSFFRNHSSPGRPQLTLVVNDQRIDTPKSKIIGRDDFHGMGIDFGDVNNDGFLDWGVSNFGADYAFHQSHFTWIHTGENAHLAQGKAPFVDQSETLGLARTREIPWDLRFADFDNDGYLEVFQSIGFVRGQKDWTPFAHELALQNDLIVKYPQVWHRMTDQHGWAGNGPNSFFVRNQAGRFVDIGPELGFQEPAVSRGIATTDIDRDGQIDFFVGNQSVGDSLYMNKNQSENRYLVLDLDVVYDPHVADAVEILEHSAVPQAPARDAIGATVTLLFPDGKKSTSQIDGGSGFGGKKHRFAHFGLGKRDLGDEKLMVKIDWRDDSGKVHSKTLTVTPGWHKVLLGQRNGLAAAAPAGGAK